MLDATTDDAHGPAVSGSSAPSPYCARREPGSELAAESPGLRGIFALDRALATRCALRRRATHTPASHDWPCSSEQQHCYGSLEVLIGLPSTYAAPSKSGGLHQQYSSISA